MPPAPDGELGGITPPLPPPTLFVPPVLEGGFDFALPPPADGVAGLLPLEEEAGRAGVAELLVGSLDISYLGFSQ